MEKTILTVSQVKTALYLEDDYNQEELQRYAELASTFVLQKVNYDFTQEDTINPLAVQLATLYVREQYFSSKGGEYNKDHDYAIGIASLIVDLQCIADSKNAAKAVDDLIAAIPVTASITLLDEQKVITARAAYTALYTVDRKYVSTLATLVSAESKIVALRG